MASEDASATALPKIRKERKAAQIISANSGKSLEDFASANNVTVSTATALTSKSPTLPGAGREALVVGNAFSMNEGDTSTLISGESGVFMVRVTKKEAAPTVDNFSTYANNLKSSAAGRVNGDVFNALKEGADIEDKRATFYQWIASITYKSPFLGLFLLEKSFDFEYCGSGWTRTHQTSGWALK